MILNFYLEKSTPSVRLKPKNLES